jgi:LysM repeat protein
MGGAVMAILMPSVVARSLETDAPVRRTRTAVRVRRIRVSEASVEGVLFLLMAASLVILAGSTLGRFLTAPATPPPARVVVQKGDSLWKLAARYGDPDVYILRRMDDIARRNNIRQDESLQPGDVLYVPASPGRRGRSVADR